MECVSKAAPVRILFDSVNQRTYVTKDLKDILGLKTENTAIRKKSWEINFNENTSTKSLIYRYREMKARARCVIIEV